MRNAFHKGHYNQEIMIKSYTGIAVEKEVIDYLKVNVEGNDERFDYAHWNIDRSISRDAESKNNCPTRMLFCAQYDDRSIK